MSKKKTPRRRSAEPTAALISLGCPKNLVDSERMLGLLHDSGYRIVREPVGADLVVVNTCGFLDTARAESMEVIGQIAELKRAGRVGSLLVAGCLAQRDGQALRDAVPQIDQVLGVFARDQIATLAATLSEATPEQRVLVTDAPDEPLVDIPRFRVTPRHLAYLRIAEGCDRSCAFCSIPSMRGKYASKTIEQVVDEAEHLAADGTRELVVIAQDTSYYGRDLDGRPRLAELLGRLADVDALEWIRLMYLYPMHLDDDLLEVVSSSPKVLPYLDLPLQHINDEVLRRMRRGVDRVQTEALLARLRERIEGLVLRTTLIAGFPGETETQFEELVEFVEQQCFERLGVFAYRFEPGTPSAELDGHLDDEIKQQRRDRLMQVQREIALRRNQAQIGQRCDVLIDGRVPGEKNAYIGRSQADAPEVDPLVFVTGQEEKIRPGQFVPCEIVAFEEYDLIAVAVGPPR